MLPKSPCEQVRFSALTPPRGDYDIAPLMAYFPAVTTRSSNEVVISSAIADRYELAEGDSMILTDPVSGRAYRLKVVGVVSYAPGLYAFQSIANTRSLLGETSDYFNAVVSSRAPQHVNRPMRARYRG